MKERILRLCKRLNKFSLDEIVNIADDVNESVLELLLITLVNEQKLIKQGDIYFYNKEMSLKKVRLPLRIQFQDEKIVEIILRCFCCKIPMETARHIAQVGEHSLEKFYSFFREKLYSEQYNILSKKYSEIPRIPRTRTFFEKSIFFYTYGNNVYVVKNKFGGCCEQSSSRKEVCEFKKVYSYLKRLESHNKNQINIHHKIAESIWRKDKTFDELYESLKKITGL